MKLPGAVLVLLGAFAFFGEYSHALRRELALIRDLSGALTQLAGEIRWKMLSLPEGIRRLSQRKASGHYFTEIVRKLESNIPLQDAWNSVFSALPGTIAVILCGLEWGGDIRRQEAAILYAARQMTELCESRRETLRQREKLCAAAALSGAGLLVMILM